MKCFGCYTITEKEEYCLACRKKMFDKARIPTKLLFDAPKAENLSVFQENTKHLSISGVQLKYSLRLENNNLVLTEKNGEFILKPIPPTTLLHNINDAPANEHLTMQMAEKLFGIRTAANCLIAFRDGDFAYLTKRFDRQADGRKFAQEDFAQLTGRTKYTAGVAYKYEGSYEEIGVLIKKYVAAYMPELEHFFKLVVFNYVVSNGDAHLKNFSLTRTDLGEYKLSPAYDLMSSVIHTPDEADTALELYNKDMESGFYSTYGYYGRANFLELAARLGIKENRATKIIDVFAQKEAAINSMIDQSFLSEPVKEIYYKNVVDKLKRICP